MFLLIFSMSFSKNKEIKRFTINISHDDLTNDENR